VAEQAERERQTLQKAEQERWKQLEAARLENERLEKERLAAEEAERQRRVAELRQRFALERERQGKERAEIKRRKRERKYARKKRKDMSLAARLQEFQSGTKERLFRLNNWVLSYKPLLQRSTAFLKLAIPLITVAGVGAIPIGYLPFSHNLTVARVWVFFAISFAIALVYSLRTRESPGSSLPWRFTLMAFSLFAAIGWSFPQARGGFSYWLYTNGHSRLCVLESRIAIWLKPDDVYSHLMLGWGLAGTGKHDAAIQAFRETLRLDPNSLSAHNGIAVVSYRKGDIETAVQEFHECVRLSPNDSLLHDWLGIVLSARNDVEGAVQQYREALRIQPNLNRHYNLGTYLEGHGKLEEAMKEYQETLRIQPDYQPAIFGIKNVEDKTKNRSAASLNQDDMPSQQNNERVELGK
jgi:tetratricopeptide (TPR) repeat protein